MSWETSIGLEVHAQLRCRSKMFCGCAVRFGAAPNSLSCPVCLGLPGALPVVNRRALELGIRTALALEAEIAGWCVFDRKNYFYPDLPKGYQITQYAHPLARGGRMPFLAGGRRRSVRIRRLHLEEDAGKLIHRDGAAARSLIDFNRCGVPLVEIVTEPDLRSPGEARAFVSALRDLLRAIGVCDGDMEKGNLRVDANISLRRAGAAQPGVVVEVKNLNSFRFLEQALAYEECRLREELSRGRAPVAESRMYDESSRATRRMRLKERSPDYRYFPDPDLPPLVIPAEWVATERARLPEVPWRAAARLAGRYGLRESDAEQLARDPGWVRYFEEVCALHGDARRCASWIVNNRARLDPPGSLPAERLAELLDAVAAGRISSGAGERVLAAMVSSGRRAGELIAEMALAQLSDVVQIEQLAHEVLAEAPELVERYRGGRTGLLDHFVGRLMRRSGGRANPRLAARILKDLLERGP